MAVVVLGLSSLALHGQEKAGAKESIAIVAIDAQGLSLDNISMGNLVRLELEKTRQFEVLDKYDVAHLLEKNNIAPEKSFGKRKLVDIGELLGADKMLTGSAEKFGDKIIFILRLIDVEDSKIEKTSVMEYIYEEEHIQRMARVSVNDLLGIENDKEVIEVLVNFERPITSDKASLRLNGPRFGVQAFSGTIADRLRAPKSEGGFNSYAFSSVFAYQHEFQYISSGEFQALFEMLGAVNGIETGHFTPSFTILNGLRYHGWEIGFGPVFRVSKTAHGYFDDSGKWFREHEMQEGENYEIVKTIDSRGNLELSTGLVFAVGKTFTSGYLHLPINLYYSPTPQLDSHVFGLMLGFTIAKRPRVER